MDGYLSFIKKIIFVFSPHFMICEKHADVCQARCLMLVKAVFYYILCKYVHLYCCCSITLVSFLLFPPSSSPSSPNPLSCILCAASATLEKKEDKVVSHFLPLYSQYGICTLITRAVFIIVSIVKVP